MCRDIVHTMSRHFLCLGALMCRVIVPLFLVMCQDIVPFLGAAKAAGQRTCRLAVPGVPGAILLPLRLLYTGAAATRGRLDKRISAPPRASTWITSADRSGLAVG